MAKRGTSNAPLILGIVGALVSLPGLLCASACGAFMSLGGGAGLGGVFFLVGFIPVVLGFISAFFGKSNPVIAGIGLLVSAGFSFIIVVMTGFSSLFAWAALILFVIGGILAFTQQMEDDGLDVQPQGVKAVPATAPNTHNPPAPRGDAGGVVCVKCNAVNKPGSKFCHKCGNSLAESRKENVGAEVRVCQKCGFTNTMVNKYCVKCGNELLGSQQQAQASPVQPPVVPQTPKKESVQADDVTVAFDDTGSSPVKSEPAPVKTPDPAAAPVVKTPDPAPVDAVKSEPVSAPVKPEKDPEPDQAQPPPAYNMLKNSPPTPVKGWRPLDVDSDDQDPDK